MIYSKTMRMEDYEILKAELQVVDKILGMLNGGDPAQHPMRRWEYAMALSAYSDWSKKKLGATGNKGPYIVSDHGCATGMLAPMMRYFGNEVWMYEVWSWGNQEGHAVWQMEKVVTEINNPKPYKMIHRAMDQLIPEDNGVDVAYIISTIEHAENHQPQFRKVCQTVNDGGMIFVTSDFAERGGYGFVADNVRPDGMFWRETYEALVKIGEEEGFKLMGGGMDYSWDESCRLVNNYGFGCLAMEKV